LVFELNSFQYVVSSVGGETGSS